MSRTIIYNDPNPRIHLSNREKNDFLADTLKQLNPTDSVIEIVRKDEDEKHSWWITFKS
jgi:hypothetical protein